MGRITLSSSSSAPSAAPSAPATERAGESPASAAFQTGSASVLAVAAPGRFDGSLDTTTVLLVAELALLPGWKSITKRKDALPDAEEWKDRTGKLPQLIR